MLVEIHLSMKAVVLFSGGKDSTYALYHAMLDGYEIEELIIIEPTEEDSYMYHIPVISWARLIADALDINYSVYKLNDDMENLKEILKKYDVDTIVAGAIASEYQRSRIANICEDLGYELYVPLWGMNQRILLEEMMLLNFKIMIVGVAVEGMDKSFLGKIIDTDIFRRLTQLEKKYRINIAGEGGEYETLVVDAPFFKKRLKIEEFTTHWDGMRGYIEIKNATLAEKN